MGPCPCLSGATGEVGAWIGVTKDYEGRGQNSVGGGGCSDGVRHGSRMRSSPGLRVRPSVLRFARSTNTLSCSHCRSADTAVGNLPGSAPIQNRAAAINPRPPTTAGAEMVGGRLEARRDSRPPSAEGKSVSADVGESSRAVHRGSGGESGRQYSNQRNRERAMMLNRVMEALGLGHLSVPTP